MRTNLQDNILHRPLLQSGVKGGVMRQEIAGATMTLDADSPFIVTLDPAQALTLTLPAVARGLNFLLLHQSTGAFDITVSSPVTRAGAAGATTIGTVSQNESALITCDGVSWFCGVMKQT